MTPPRRLDGRSPTTLRPLTCEFGGGGGGGGIPPPQQQGKDGVSSPSSSTLSRPQLPLVMSTADGSALWKSGATQVWAMVHGPLAPKLPHEEDPTQAVVSVTIKSAEAASTDSLSAGTSPTTWMVWEAWIQPVLQTALVRSAYPRTVIRIMLHLVTVDGSVGPALLHAAIAALMDAGLELYYIPTALSLCYMPISLPPSTDATQSSSSSSTTPLQLWLDPTDQEEQEALAVWMLVLGTPLSTSSSATASSALNQKQDYEDIPWLACHMTSSSPAPPSLSSSLSSSSSSSSWWHLLPALQAVAIPTSRAVAAFFRLAVEHQVTDLS